jgi:hypothetical protein
MSSELETQRQNKEKNITGVTAALKNNKSSLPEKIKNHLESISNRQSNDKSYHKKLKYRIQSSIGSR